MLLAILLIIFPSVALADPVSASVALASGSLGFGALTISWGTVIFTAASFIYGQSQKKKIDRANFDANKARQDQFAASLKDRNVSGIATEFNYRRVYGQSRVGGNIVAMFSTGAVSELKHLVAIACQHEVESIDDVYLNGKSIGPLDSNGFAINAPYGSYSDIPTTVKNIGSNSFNLPDDNYSGLKVFYQVQRTSKTIPNITNADFDRFVPAYVEDIEIPYSLDGTLITYSPDFNDVEIIASYNKRQLSSYLRVIKHLGEPGQVADSALVSETSGRWNNNCTLSGHAYVYIRMDQTLSEFQQGLPKVDILVKGAKLYDPRTTLTEYSTNPALVAYDYLTSEFCNVPAADVPESQFIAAANDCDDFLTSVNGPRYTFNGVITSDQSQGEVLEKIAESMAGGIVATSWDIFAGKYKAPILTLTQSDIVGEFAVSPGLPRNDIYNTVKGQFISADNGYESNDFVPYVNQALLTIDGEALETNIDLPYTNTQQRVTNLARIFVENNRNAFSVNGKFSLKAWGLKIGDRVSFDSDFFGQSGKVFRVTDKSLGPDVAVNLGLKEDSPEIYDEADQQEADQTLNTNFPNPFDIAPLEQILCESGTDQLIVTSSGDITSRILAQWPAASTPSILQNGEIEVQWLLADNLASGNWQSIKVSGNQTSAYLSPVNDDRFYFVRARTVNPYLGLKSPWVTTQHKVIGKSEPPPNVESFLIDGDVLSWSQVQIIDLLGYQIRFQYGANNDWNSATLLTNNVLLASPYQMVSRPVGPVTLMIKAIDTSGNESLLPTSIFTELADLPIANVVEVIQFDPTFEGQITGGSVVSGDVCATANDSFYGADNQSFYTLEAESFYEVGTYQEVQYITEEVQISSALAGSLMTLDITTQGSDLTIEYRVVGGGSFYGLDGDSFYDIDDSESFYSGPGPWLVWPGQIAAGNDIYQFRVTLGAGNVQGKIYTMALTIDAPDLEETISDLTISASGTVPSYTTAFSVIKNVQVTLQANASGAESVEVDKTVNLSPIIKAYNAAHTAVSGAKVDLVLKGY